MSKNIQLAILWKLVVGAAFGGPALYLNSVWLAFIAGAASVLTYFIVLVLTGELESKGGSND